MRAQFSFFITVWFKFAFLFTPFFVLSMFLTMTEGFSAAQRRKIALQVTAAIASLSVIVFLFGNVVFSLFGITLDAFRVGAGVLLFISAIHLTQSKDNTDKIRNNDDDIAVVPLAIPIVIGPAVIGMLMVFGSEISSGQRMLGVIALLGASLSTGTILLLGTRIENILGRRGLKIMSKITGLVLAALAAQMIMVGVKNAMLLP